MRKKFNIHFVIALLLFVASFFLPALNGVSPQGWQGFLLGILVFLKGDLDSWNSLLMFLSAIGNTAMLGAAATLFVKEARFREIVQWALAVQIFLTVSLGAIFWEVRFGNGFYIWIISFVWMFVALKKQES